MQCVKIIGVEKQPKYYYVFVYSIYREIGKFTFIEMNDLNLNICLKMFERPINDAQTDWSSNGQHYIEYSKVYFIFKSLGCAFVV